MIFQEKRDGCRNDPAFLLAILYTFGFFGFLFSLLLTGVPESSSDMIGQLIPVLSMIQGGIIQYFYQKQSQQLAEKKDDTIKTLATTAATTAAAQSVPTKVETATIEANTANVNTTNGKD